MSSRPIGSRRKTRARIRRGIQPRRKTAANRLVEGGGGRGGRAVSSAEKVIDGAEELLNVVRCDLPHVPDAEGRIAQRAVAVGDGHGARRQMGVEGPDVDAARV